MKLTELVEHYCLIVPLLLKIHCAENVQVTTQSGTFIGLMTNVSFLNSTRPVESFLGIPYAEPPIGERRFRKPVPKEPISDPYNATFHRSACIQIRSPTLKSLNYHEDCLYLSVYVPSETDGAANASYPVMLWIHGGGFTGGGGSDYYDGSVLAALGRIIVVTINYRLAALGFLSTGDGFLPGNYGLWDQQMAIKWVHDNIKHFGGDPDHVTLAGESAGASSVFYQGLFPNNSGLFHRLIAQSGSILSDWAFTDIPSASEFGELVGCKNGTSENLVQCLRQVDPGRVDSAVNSDQYKASRPVADGEFIKKDPMDTISRLNNSADTQFFLSLDLLSGMTDMEGYSVMVSLWRELLNVTDVVNFPVSRFQFETVVVPTVQQSITRNLREQHIANEMINFQYTDWTAPLNPNKTRNALLKLTSDVVFKMPIITVIDAHDIANAQGRSYLYEFAIVPYLVSQLIPRPAWASGANHADELGFVFGFSRGTLDAANVPVSFIPPIELLISDRIIKWWSNFVRNGNPNDVSSSDWPEYSKETRSYMKITRTVPSFGIPQNYYGESAATFWTRLFPFIFKSTPSPETTPETPPPSTQMPTSEVYTVQTISDKFGVDLITADNVIIVLIVVCGCLLLLLVGMCMYRVYSKSSQKYQI